MANTTVDVSEICKAVRRKHSLSQSDLAKLLRTHAMTISRWERGSLASWTTHILLVLLENEEPATIERLAEMLEREAPHWRAKGDNDG